MLKFRMAAAAQADVRDIAAHSRRVFGDAAHHRYRALLVQAIQDICVDPYRLGSVGWPAGTLRIYHLRHSRRRAWVQGQMVLEPRHLLLYEQTQPDMIDILRVLHDAMDLERHVSGISEDSP